MFGIVEFARQLLLGQMQHSSIRETVWHWLRCQRESWLANTFMRKRSQKCCWESHLLIHDRLVKQELLVNGDQINQTVAVSHSSTGDRGIEGPGLGAWMSQILICVHLQLHVPVPGARGWGLVNASLGHFYTSWLEWKEHSFLIRDLSKLHPIFI